MGKLAFNSHKQPNKVRGAPTKERPTKPLGIRSWGLAEPVGLCLDPNGGLKDAHRRVNWSTNRVKGGANKGHRTKVQVTRGVQASRSDEAYQMNP